MSAMNPMRIALTESPIMKSHLASRFPSLATAILAALAVTLTAKCGEPPRTDAENGASSSSPAAARNPGLLPAACAASGAEQLDLLRNAAVTAVNPVAPPLATLLSTPADPNLNPVTDLETHLFVSGGAFPHQATDLDPSLPLVFYQLNSPIHILKLQKSSGNLVITYAASSQKSITFPRPGGGAMIGGARAGVILMADGSVWNWGADFGFRLGQGNTVATDLYLPAKVHGPGNVGTLNSIMAIAAGEPFSMALKSDGTVWTWGSNGFGLLGIGDTGPASSNVPVQVVDTTGPGSCLNSIISVGTRGYHALALKSDGTVYGWGWCAKGECGNNSIVYPSRRRCRC